MRKLMSLKFLVVISMASFLLTAPQIRAQDEFGLGGEEESAAESENTSNADKPESEVIEELCKRMCGNGR